MTEAVQTMKGTDCGSWCTDTLLHTMRDLKVKQMNMQHSLIWKLILYTFELSHNTTDATKNICGAKCEGKVDHPTVNIDSVMKFHPDCKNLNEQSSLDKLKTINSEAIEVNLVSQTQKISGELSISQSSVVCYLHDLGKSTQIGPHVTKIL